MAAEHMPQARPTAVDTHYSLKRWRRIRSYFLTSTVIPLVSHTAILLGLSRMLWNCCAILPCTLVWCISHVIQCVYVFAGLKRQSMPFVWTQLWSDFAFSICCFIKPWDTSPVWMA